MKKITQLLVCLFLISALMLTGCGQGNQAQEKPEGKMKVGFIYVGPIGDGGWTYAHNEGRKQLEEELGVETIYKESVPEGPEVEKVAQDMIDQGAKIIFATSFGFMDYIEKLSKKYPDVKFLHCSGYKSGPNFINYFGKIEEPRYLSGIAAGLKTKSNKIGYVAAFEIPEVVRGINAFTLGVLSVNPNAEVHVRWTHTWYDPSKEKEAAKALLDEKCDVIAQHQDTAGPQQAAEERGVWSIGYNTDMKNVAPKAYLTAPVWNWGPYYVKEVKAIMDGTWKAENFWGGMQDDMVALAPLTDNASPEAKEKVAALEKDMKDGKFTIYSIFTGPIKDQSGAVKIVEGKSLSDKELLSMDWFVQGVVGNLNKAK